MSLRKKMNKPDSTKISKEELIHLKKLNMLQQEADRQGIPVSQLSNNQEQKVFFKKGDSKGKIIAGGENEFIPLGDSDGTITHIKYRGKDRKQKSATTVITKDKKLLDQNGNLIRELY